jgi:hypothetical protein
MLNTIVLLSVLSSAGAADPVTGTWQIAGEVYGNPVTSVCTFQQEGETLTGSCSSDGGGRQEITGRVAESAVTFQYRGDYEGQPLTVVYTGSLTSAEEIRGRMEVHPFDVEGTFTAKRVPPANP